MSKLKQEKRNYCHNKKINAIKKIIFQNFGKKKIIMPKINDKKLTIENMELKKSRKIKKYQPKPTTQKDKNKKINKKINIFKKKLKKH